MLVVASERFIHCGVSTCPWLRCSQWVGAGVVSLPDQAVLQGTIAAHGVVIACRRQASGECPWLNVSHWGGADAVPVVTSGATDHLELNGSVGESLASQSALVVLICRGV